MEPEFTDADEEAIEEMDDPVLAEREDVESLHEKAERAETVDERLEELNEKVDVVDTVDDGDLEELAKADEPVVIEADDLEHKNDPVDEVAGVFAEELETDSPFTGDELRERFTPLELREKLVGEDGDVGEELSDAVSEEPEPDGETVDSDELEESAADVQREELEDEARESVADELESVGWDAQAEKVRSGEMDLDELGVSIDAE